MKVKERENGKERLRYRDSPPDVTSTGIGKSYYGHRIYYSAREGSAGIVEYISNDGDVRYVTRKEKAQFLSDLAVAAQADPKVAAYLEEKPELKLRDEQEKVRIGGLAGSCLVDELQDCKAREPANENTEPDAQKSAGSGRGTT